MAYRYCPECDKWYETSEYGVSESGETICIAEEDHGALHGYIDGSITTEDDLRRNLGLSHSDIEDEVDAAKRQDLID